MCSMVCCHIFIKQPPQPSPDIPILITYTIPSLPSMTIQVCNPTEGMHGMLDVSGCKPHGMSSCNSFINEV